MTAAPPHQRSFVMMFQDYAPFPHRDVAANIAFDFEMRKIDGRQRQQLVTQTLDLVEHLGFDRRAIASLDLRLRNRLNKS